MTVEERIAYKTGGGQSTKQNTRRLFISESIVSKDGSVSGVDRIVGKQSDNFNRHSVLICRVMTASISTI